MITTEKLQEYSQYNGSFDGFYMQKVKNGTNIATESEWYLIDKLIQEVELVNKNLASDTFANKLENKLQNHCDNQKTIEMLKQMAKN